MKPTKHILLCAALALALISLPVTAAGEAGAKKPRPTKREPRRPLPESVALRPDAHDYSDLSGQVVYQLLLAEVALQRGRKELASQAYADLALRTRDPGVIERATEVAGHARRMDLVLELARLWVEVQPDSKRAQQVLIGVLVLANQLDGMAPQLIRILEADPAALPANLLALNRMFARSPDRQAVLRLIREVCKPFLGLAEAHYAVAVAAAAAGERLPALGEVRRALELRPDWEMAALLEAQLLAQDSSTEAIAFLQRFVERHPAARDVQLQLARALVAEKRYSEAKHQFEQLLLAYPDHPDVVFPVAILALQENDTALAEKQLKHLLTLDFQQKSAAYYYLGQIAEEGKRTDEALGHYQQVEAGELYVPAQVRSAALLTRSGRLDEARQQLDQAAEKNPQFSVQLSIAEAALLRDAKQNEAAFELLDRELGKQPEQPDLLYESALMAEKIGRLELMESRLRKLIELQPESAQAYNALGYSYADRNLRLPEARQLLDKALLLSPEDPFILDSMGWLLYRQGDLEGALSYLQRAHGLRPDPEIAAHAGEVLWMLGRRNEALRTWQEAQKKDPSNEVLQRTMQRFVP
jgi:tetratricopeptide (TPR) repeat protein